MEEEEADSDGDGDDDGEKTEESDNEEDSDMLNDSYTIHPIMSAASSLMQNQHDPIPVGADESMQQQASSFTYFDGAAQGINLDMPFISPIKNPASVDSFTSPSLASISTPGLQQRQLRQANILTPSSLFAAASSASPSRFVGVSTPASVQRSLGMRTRSTPAQATVAAGPNHHHPPHHHNQQQQSSKINATNININANQSSDSVTPQTYQTPGAKKSPPSILRKKKRAFEGLPVNSPFGINSPNKAQRGILGRLTSTPVRSTPLRTTRGYDQTPFSPSQILSPLDSDSNKLLSPPANLFPTPERDGLANNIFETPPARGRKLTFDGTELCSASAERSTGEDIRSANASRTDASAQQQNEDYNPDSVASLESRFATVATDSSVVAAAAAAVNAVHLATASNSNQSASRGTIAQPGHQFLAPSMTPSSSRTFSHASRLGLVGNSRGSYHHESPTDIVNSSTNSLQGSPLNGSGIVNSSSLESPLESASAPRKTLEHIISNSNSSSVSGTTAGSGGNFKGVKLVFPGQNSVEPNEIAKNFSVLNSRMGLAKKSDGAFLSSSSSSSSSSEVIDALVDENVFDQAEEFLRSARRSQKANVFVVAPEKQISASQ